MNTSQPTITHEAVYQLAYERRWLELLDLVHRHVDTIAGDPLLAQAVETFLTAFFGALQHAEPSSLRDELEKLFLLHTGRIYRISEQRFEQVVERLVLLHDGHPEAALGYARFYPDNERCAAVIDQYGVDEPDPVIHAQEEHLALSESRPCTDADHTISLFKSQQEVDFFMAAREVFATYFVYPNVALSCLVDYEQIRGQLSGEERRYFFRSLVDCVVFDQHEGYRPCYFFELDSVLHDTEAQQKKDRCKERILALAGQKLHRIRKRTATSGRAAFVALLREVIGGDEGG